MEQMKWITINNKKTDYKADIYGNIWTFKKENKPHILKVMTNRYGYYVVNLHINKKQKQYRVNRLIAETFIPNPNQLPQVNHLSGDKTDNSIFNLEWCTAKENTRHAILNNLRINSGEDFHSSKLSNNQVHLICQLLEENKLKIKDIPDRIGPDCTINMVQNIFYSNSWSHISKLYDLKKHTIEENHGKSKLTKKKVHKICYLLSTTNLSYKEISKKVKGCTVHDVNHIKNRYTWRSISDKYDFSNRN